MPGQSYRARPARSVGQCRSRTLGHPRGQNHQEGEVRIEYIELAFYSSIEKARICWVFAPQTGPVGARMRPLRGSGFCALPLSPNALEQHRGRLVIRVLWGQIVGPAVSGRQGELPDCDTPGGAQVHLAVVLDKPASGDELIVDLAAGPRFGPQVCLRL